MIANSKKVVLLCDSTKFDHLSFSKICDFRKIHSVVTDEKPTEQWIDFLKENDVELLYYEK